MNETTLKVCKVFEEVKCIKCTQQHRAEYHTELKHKWLTLQNKFQSIK